MSVKYIPPSKNVGESVHDINENFAALDKQSETIAQTAANKADATDVQDLATQLNDKANTSDLESKVSNDQSGATELLDNLIENESTPQNEDSIILKHLNQYVRTPFTSLWNWIKSNLAKVATSGSYNDLSDKPDIPTVDSSFSEDSTNAVAGNVILSALNSKANKTELQALSNQVSNKADADHNHDSAYAAKNHTHNYAGSSTAGGSATTANALTSKSIGSDVVPVYFDANGKPAVCKYTLGDASAKSVDTTITNNSANLITSGGVAAALTPYRPNIVKKMAGTSGTSGYICFAQLTIIDTYANLPIEFVLLRRGAATPCKVSIKFINTNSVDPDILSFVIMGESYGVYAYKSATSTWQLYVRKSEPYDTVTLAMVNNPQYHMTVTYPGTQVNTKHTASTNNPVVDASWGYRVETANNANTWNGLTDDTMTENTTDTRLMVLNGSKVQHRQIDTLPFLSSKDLSQSVLFTSSSDVKTATIDNLFTDYSLVWCQFVGSKTTHTHIIPLAYLKSKKSLVFKDGDVPFNILYVSDTQIRWFDVQASGAETYTSVTIVKII